MKKLLLLTFFVFMTNAFAGLLQNEDFKTEAELITAGGTKAQLLNEDKVYSNTLSETLDDAFSLGKIIGLTTAPSNGDILYYNNGWQKLPAGTNGHVLTLSTGLPSWQSSPASGDMVLISRQTASNSASIDFTSIDNTTYDSYELVIHGVVPVNNAVNLLLRVSNSGVFQTTGYTWQNIRITTGASGISGQAGTATGIALDAAGADNISNSSSAGANWVIDINDCAKTDVNHTATYTGYYLGSTDFHITGSGKAPNTNACDGFRLLMDSGNISKGTFSLYGRVK